MLNHRNNYLLCLDHAKDITRTQGKVFIPMDRFSNGEDFCCGKCARGTVETPADVLVTLEDTLETHLYFLNQYLHLEVEGITFGEFAPLDKL